MNRKRRRKLVTTGLMALMMCGIMSLLVTAINQGFRAAMILPWLRNWDHCHCGPVSGRLCCHALCLRPAAAVRPARPGISHPARGHPRLHLCAVDDLRHGGGQRRIHGTVPECLDALLPDPGRNCGCSPVSSDPAGTETGREALRGRVRSLRMRLYSAQ